MKTRFHDLGLAIMRIGFSGLLLTHGIPKLKTLFSGSIEFPEVMGMPGTLTLILAVLAEVLAPVMIIIGFKTRPAAAYVALFMFLAAFVFHADDPFGKKEFPLLYCLGFLGIALIGAGKYALENRK